MSEKKYQKGDVIFRQGDEGSSFYRVLDGVVEIIANYGEADEKLLTEVTKDQIFGEMAVIEYRPRSAAAVAQSDVTVQEISEKEVQDYLEKNPKSALQIMEQISSRLRDLTKEYEEVSTALKDLENARRNEGLIDKIRRSIKFFNTDFDIDTVNSAETDRLIRKSSHSEGFAGETQSYSYGTVICKEGETFNCMYDIHAGKVGIYTAYGLQNEKKLTELYPNTFFGEMGMISGEPRSATAVSLSDDTVVEIITQDELEALFEKNPPKAAMIMNHLSYRLRALTADYLNACKKLDEAL